MKTKKLPAKKSSGSSKRGIIVKGEWKAVNLDPGLFSDEGMEGLVCFEELTDYSLVEPEKTAIAEESVKMTGKERKKRKANEIEAEEELASEADATEVDVDDKPAKKKKKKKKGSKKDDSSQTASSVDQNIKTVEDQGGRDQIVEVGSPDVTSDQQDQTSGTAKTQSKLSKKEKKKQKRKKKKKTASKEAKLQAEAIDSNAQTEHVGKVNPQSKKKAKNWTDAALADSKGQDTDVSAWKDLFVPEPVLKALSKLGFSAPTPIQALTLPSAVRDHLDVLGAAETGSGKTLSFGIPMIHTILEWRKASNCKTDQGSKPDSVSDLESIYMPLDGIPNNNNNEENDTTEENEEKNNGNDDDCRITVNDSSVDDQSQVNEVCSEACVTDDVSDINDNKKQATEKQPLLGLVLTPTRELAVQVKHHIDAAAQFTGIKTAIVVGGMAPQKQQRMLMRRPEIVIATPGRLWEMIKERHPHLQNLRQLRCLVIDEADRMVEKGHFAELENLLEMLNTSQFNPKRQTFVFSATLTMIHSMPVRLYQKKGKKLEQRSKLELLMEKVGIKDKPKVVDLTRKEATVETLMETKIICTKEEKDFYLYYFLLQYPGRTMVFANSIDCIKRLNSLLVILDCNPLPLHANMHQKQRLKNLERFAEMESCVLLTTDVAARGLDIPNVQHVIHYQVPRTSETYVHRSGRTARATKEGLSLLLIGPDDMINFKKICRTLGKDEDLPAFPVETNCMAAIKERVTLARKIEKIEYFHGREKQHNSWVRQAAEAMDIDVDDDLLLGRGKDENDEREQQKLVKGLKKQLKHLTSQPVFRNEMKTKYPTQMGKLNLPQLPIFKADTAITSVTNHRLALKMKRKQKH